MKKMLPLIFAALLSASFVSCGNDAKPADSTETTDTAAAETTSEKPETTDAKTIQTSFTFPAKKVESVRKQIVDYMYEMATIEWYPTQTINFTKDISYFMKTELEYKTGVVHKGMPYCETKATLEHFKDVIKEDGEYVGGTAYKTMAGNTCSTSVLAAWYSVGSSISCTWTKDMLPDCGTGTIPVGDYEWQASKVSTKEIVAKSGQNRIMQSYAAVQPGDALITYTPEHWHTRMACGEPVVVYNANGSINPSKSYIPFHEQVGVVDSNNSTWRLDKHISFTDLYKSFYIPVTMAELQDNKHDDQTFEITSFNADWVTMQAIGRIKSNYRIHVANLTFESVDGTVLSSVSAYPNSKIFMINAFENTKFAASLPSGDYVMKLSVTTGNGEFELINLPFEK